MSGYGEVGVSAASVLPFRLRLRPSAFFCGYFVLLDDLVHMCKSSLVVSIAVPSQGTIAFKVGPQSQIRGEASEKHGVKLGNLNTKWERRGGDPALL
jgi:hypothetical protein